MRRSHLAGEDVHHNGGAAAGRLTVILARRLVAFWPGVGGEAPQQSPV